MLLERVNKTCPLVKDFSVTISITCPFMPNQAKNDVISHVGTIFRVNKFVALVTFAGIYVINVSGREKGRSKFYFTL